MGFRYRKSINLGGGFRINLSKSGVGYSWGVKGYRVTKTAKGTTRTTASIPGTGISYVQETGANKDRHEQSARLNDSNYYDTKNIVNNVATAMVSEGMEDMLASASKSLKIDRFSTIGLWVTIIWGLGLPIMFVAAVVFLAVKIYVRTYGMIDLDYCIDTDQQSTIDKRMKPMVSVASCSKVWRIVQTSKVFNTKYSAGAGSMVNRTTCKASTQAPFPFRANLQVASFKSGKETLLFLPDKLFIIQGSKIGALSYSDIFSKAHTTRFVESESVPGDTQVVGHTWRYVNKSGGPDRRFNNNRRLPICLYGELELSSTSGLNTVIMFSNPHIQN